MTYRDYEIKRSDVVRTPSGRRRGTLDVYDPQGRWVDTAFYTVGNHLSLQSAYRKLCAKIDIRIDNPEKDKK